MSAKYYGPTVDVYLDGSGYADDVQIMIQCDGANEGAAWKCPFAQGYVSPMREEDRCLCRREGECGRLFVKIKALKKVKEAVNKRIKELEEEMENAD